MKEYSYQVEKLDEVRQDAEPLLLKHWEEIALNKDTIELDPDWDSYYSLEKEGYVRIYTAREVGENTLVGYFVVIQSPSLHYKNDIFCVNDIIYVSKEVRGERVGANLIKFAEDDLKSFGVSVLTINTKTHAPFDGLLEKLGYTHIENIFSKCFKEKV